MVGIVAVLLSAAGPLTDIDAFWHVRSGSEILDSGLGAQGRGWTYTQTAQWTSPQWLSEVLMAAAVNTFGWSGLVWARLALVVLTLVGLVYSVHRVAPARVGAVVIAPACIALSQTAQERPQLLSFAVAPLLGVLFLRAVTERTRPKLALLAATSVAWSNVHGLWVLLPLVCALCAGGRLLDQGWSDPFTRRWAAASLLTLLAGHLNPLGVRTLALPIHLARSTPHLLEWQATSLRLTVGVALVAVVGVVVLAWALRPTRASRATLLYVAVFTAFGMAAARNATPAVLLLAPVVAHESALTWPGKGAATSLRESRALSAAAAVILGAGLLVSGIRTYSAHPLDTPEVPTRITEALSGSPDGTRVLNDYNTAGPLLGLTDQRVRVAIDGRVDYFSPAFVRQYQSMMALLPGWQQTLQSVGGDVAVLLERAPLTDVLLARGWTPVVRDRGYVLMRRE